MLKNMLQAVSKMLASSKEEKVLCAKIIVDEIISGMCPEKNEEIDEPQDEFPERKKIKSKEVLVPKGKITVEQGKIFSIEGVPLETTMLELDGKKMTCAEAIGKPFQHVQIL